MDNWCTPSAPFIVFPFSFLQFSFLLLSLAQPHPSREFFEACPVPSVSTMASATSEATMSSRPARDFGFEVALIGGQVLVQNQQRNMDTVV